MKKIIKKLPSSDSCSSCVKMLEEKSDWQIFRSKKKRVGVTGGRRQKYVVGGGQCRFCRSGKSLAEVYAGAGELSLFKSIQKT